MLETSAPIRIRLRFRRSGAYEILDVVKLTDNEKAPVKINDTFKDSFQFGNKE